MEIVHLIDYFHPNAGYQPNILSKFLQMKGYKNTIITPKIDKYYKYLNTFFGDDNIELFDRNFTRKYGVNILRVKIKTYISSRAIYSGSTFKMIDKLKPDLLFVYDIDTYSGIRFVLREKKLSYPVIFNSTMLEMASRNRFAKIFRIIYKRFITPIIIKRNLHIIKTQDDDYIHKAFNIPIQQATYISFGSDTSFFYPDISIKNDFRKKNLLKPNELLFIYAGKLDRDKGSDLLAEAFMEKIISREGYEAVLVLVGNIKEDDYELKKKFSSLESKIIRFNTVPYTELDKFYKSCDYSIFPKQVSLSFFDVQACGLPVILERNNLNNERTSFNNGHTYEQNNISDLRAIIKKMLNEHDENYKYLSDNAHKMISNNFSWNLIVNKYIEVFKNSIDKFKRGR